MELKVLRKQWENYLDECVWAEETEMDSKTFLASKVGSLLNEIDRLHNQMKLLEQVNTELREAKKNR